MFDPVHNGHLKIALSVLASFSLMEVRFMPCAIPPHKSKSQIADKDRLGMLKTAIQGIKGITVDDREFKKRTPSYTVESLKSLQAEMPDVELFLVMGADALGGLHTWHKWQDIFSLAHIIVVSRPGFSIKPDILPDNEFQTRLVNNQGGMTAQKAGSIFVHQIETPDVSSSMLRQAISQNQIAEVSDLMPAGVCEYIIANKLYNGEVNLELQNQKQMVLETVDDIKGQDVVCLDVSGNSSFADYMVVVTGTSNRHVKSISDAVTKKAKENTLKINGVEGQDQAEWILIDLGNIIVHVMQAEVRQLYDLESLWSMKPDESK